MAQLFVDPDRVQEIIKRMDQMLKEISQNDKKMKSFLDNAQSYWNDVHYKTSVDMYSDFSNKLNRVLKEAEQILLPHFINVKRAAEDYKTMKR